MRVRFPLPAWICLAVWVAACVDAAGPPAGAVRFTPSVRYRGWWALVEACSGRSGDYGAIRWYVLPNHDTFQLQDETVNGAYYPDGRQIVLGAGSELDGPLVRHEMLHALLPPRTPGHPREYFLGRCGDIVVCEDECVYDAGGPIATSDSAPVVAPTTLSVGTILAPNPVSVGADSGWFPLTVMATNNTPEAVRAYVILPPPNDPSVSSYTYSSYAYSMVPTEGGQIDSSGYEAYDGAYLHFAPAGQPGATRRFVFDNGPILQHVAPGDYNVTGKVITAQSSSTLLHIGP